MTNTQAVLIAAGMLSQANNKGPVGVFDLTVAAWAARPELFSLRGFPQYPNHKAVAVATQHLLSRRLNNNGQWDSPAHLERCGANLVKLTDAGWLEFHRLKGTILKPKAKAARA